MNGSGSLGRIALGSLLFVVGCESDTVRFLPDLRPTTPFTDLPDPYYNEGQLQIDDASLVWGCNVAATAYSLTLRTFGPAGGGTLSLFGEMSPEETHDLVLLDAAPSGAWDEYRVGPLLDEAPFVTGVSTGFDCEVEPTAVIQIFDRFDELADCVVLGPEAPQAFDLLNSDEVAAIGGCRFTYPYLP